MRFKTPAALLVLLAVFSFVIMKIMGVITWPWWVIGLITILSPLWIIWTIALVAWVIAIWFFVIAIFNS